MRNDPVMDIGLNYCIHQDDRSGKEKKTSGIKCKNTMHTEDFMEKKEFQKIPWQLSRKQRDQAME